MAVTMLVAAPMLAYAETLDYVMHGWGYGLSDDIVNAHLNLDLEKDTSNNHISFQSGQVIFDDMTYSIRSMNVVLLQDQRVIKVNGAAGDISISATGRLVALNYEGAIYDLRGYVIKDDAPQRIFISVILSQTKPAADGSDLSDVSGDEASEPLSEKQDVHLLVRHKTIVQWKDRYDFTVRVFDPALNPSMNFYHGFGFIEGVQISAKITDPVGREMRTINGTTDNTGYFVGSLIIPDNSFTGSYALDVMIHGDTITSKSQRLFFEVIPFR